MNKQQEEIKNYLFGTNLRWSTIYTMILNKLPITVDMRDEYEDIIEKTKHHDKRIIEEYKKKCKAL